MQSAAARTACASDWCNVSTCASWDPYLLCTCVRYGRTFTSSCRATSLDIVACRTATTTSISYFALLHTRTAHCADDSATCHDPPELNRAPPMVILITLVVFLAFWAVLRLLGQAQRARTMSTSTEPTKGSTTVSALLMRARQRRGTPSPPANTPPQNGAVRPTSTQDGLTWTALDDLQLTRLLTDAAQGTNTE